MIQQILIMLLMLQTAKLNTCDSNYDTNFEYQDYTFNFTVDQTRFTRKILISPDNSYMYCAANGSDGTNNNNYIFKMNLELTMQWSKAVQNDFDPTFAFELDSSGTSLYMGLEQTQ